MDGGVLMFTKKQIVKIVIPLFLEQLLTVLVGMVDTMMVSSVGEAAVSGVSLVDQLSVVILTLVSAFTAGGAVLCSQNIGKGDLVRANSYAKQLFLAAFSICIIIMAGLLPFNRAILNLIYGRAEADVMENAVKYFFVTTLSIPFYAIYISLASVFRAEGNSKISLYVSILMNLINVVGNYVGIFIFKAGVYGVAVPTTLSRVAGAIVMCLAMLRTNGKLHVDFLRDNRLDFKKIGEICGFGIPMGMENSLFHFGKVLLASLVSTLGTSAVAAYAVANTISNFTYIPGIAVGMAIPAVVGQCVGANEIAQAKQNVRRMFVLDYCILVPLVAGITIFAPALSTAFHLSDLSHSYCVKMLYINNFMMWIHPFAFMVTGVFRSASDVRFPMFVAISVMFICRIGFAYLFVLGFDMGVCGVYWAMILDWVTRAVIFVPRLLTGKWLTYYKPTPKLDKA